MSDLNDLNEKLNQFKAAESAKATRQAKGDLDSDVEAQNVNVGIRAGTELVASIAAGTIIGYALDSWLHTKPLFLIIFLLAGIGAGFFNIYRITQNIGSSVGFAALHNREKTDKKTPEK